MKKKFAFLAPLTLLLAFSVSACGVKDRPSNQNSNNPTSENSNTSTPNGGTTNISVEGVSLNFNTASVYKGKTLTLVAAISPTDASNKQVTWSSNNESVATVANGKVKGVAVGTAVITATTVDGNFTDSCTVTVVEDEEIIYTPDPTDTSIYFITNDTLSNGTLENDEYTFNISSNYKQIYVNAPDKAIVVELGGVTIENNANSPIFVQDCDKLEISAKSNTVSNIKDTRAIYVEDVDGQGKGAIFMENGDLKLKGKGTLNITANYLNGIHVKDDVKIQKLTLNVNAVNHGIRGNDSVEIVSGNINISCGGDGLHSENSDISSKGNQKGNVIISGGTVNINSWGDAIQAAYDAVIEETDTEYPTEVTLKTNKYSSYNGETVDTSTSSFYLKMNSATYSNNSYTYAAQIDGNWYKANYKGTISSGGQGGFPGGGGPGGGGPGGGGRPGSSSSTYYVYEIEKPSGATSFTLYRYQGNVSTFSTEEYAAKSDAKAFNSAYDTVEITVSSSKINFGSWSNYSSGNNNGADISAKGVKAENEIYIKGGILDVKAYDDAIHANNDGTLENGNSPLGNVNISGGTLTLYASDDGVHADYTVNITGGKTTVSSAYEGIEGNLIKVSGGEAFVYATDDGVNATQGKSSANVTVSGGLLDVEVPASGDTDGIDSNGSITISGGCVIAKGPGSASGNAFGAAAVDSDGAVTMTGGTLIVFGGIEKTPSNSNITRTLCSSSSVKAGSHTVAFSSKSFTTTLKGNTNGCVVFSELGNAALN